MKMKETKAERIRLDIIETIKKVWRKCQVLFVVLYAILLISWIISPIRSWLISIGAFEQNTIFYIIALSTTLVVTILGELKTAMSDLSKKLDKFSKESDSEIITNGILSVYSNLYETFDSIKNKREKTLDVIGLTLYSTWPQIEAWLNFDNTRDWNITLFVLNSNFIKDNTSIMPIQWVREIEVAVDRINSFVDNKRDLLLSKNINIKVEYYSNLPGIHGFSLGDDTLYISFSHWSERRLIDEPDYFYEYFHCDDKTIRANVYRGLFKNWLACYSNLPPVNLSSSPKE